MAASNFLTNALSGSSGAAATGSAVVSSVAQAIGSNGFNGVSVAFTAIATSLVSLMSNVAIASYSIAGVAKINKSGSPAVLLAARRHVMAGLESTGGRPSVIKNGERKKIPFYKEDWDVLKNISRDYREKENIKVSPGQIAAILIHKELTEKLNKKAANS